MPDYAAETRSYAGELLAILRDAEGLGELLGALLELARGAAPGPTMPTMPTERARRALELASEHGAVTAGELARATGVSRETARATLCGLASDGRLVATGRNKGRAYRLG